MDLEAEVQDLQQKRREFQRDRDRLQTEEHELEERRQRFNREKEQLDTEQDVRTYCTCVLCRCIMRHAIYIETEK